MAADDKSTALREITMSSFSRLKELVRQLEDDEKRIGQDFGLAEIEFKLKADDLAWYVAYRTDAGSVELGRIAAKPRGRA